VLRPFLIPGHHSKLVPFLIDYEKCHGGEGVHTRVAFLPYHDLVTSSGLLDIKTRDMEETARRKATPFIGDLSRGLGPPLAWTIWSAGQYMNGNVSVFGPELDNVDVWGVAFWDADRLQALGIDQILTEKQKKFEDDWGIWTA
jgi:hypothetical protein